MQLLPARVNVLWDNLGVEGASEIVRRTRETAAIALSTAGGEMAARLLNLFLQPQVPYFAGQVRTSYGQYTHNPAPVTPVQIEVVATFSPDTGNILWYRAEELHLGLSAFVLDWFESADDGAGTSVCDAGRIDAVRVSMMGLGPEMIYVLDPRTRVAIGGLGLSNPLIGGAVPRRF